MAIQYSIQKMVSDGTLSTIALGIQYLQRNDIYIRIAGEETPQSGASNGYTWSFINNTTLKILPVVPNGVEVVVHRRTDVDAMYNIYSQNAQFDEATIDENNQQLLYIAQEYLEQGLPGAGVDTLEYVRDDGSFTYYRMRRTDGSYSEEFPVPSASSSTKVLTREALRRSYAEAGYNLVDGSFEVGGTLVNANDVLLHEATGKGFTGPAGHVSAGADPTSGGFVDRSGVLLREVVVVNEANIRNLQMPPSLPAITSKNKAIFKPTSVSDCLTWVVSRKAQNKNGWVAVAITNSAAAPDAQNYGGASNYRPGYVMNGSAFLVAKTSFRAKSVGTVLSTLTTSQINTIWGYSADGAEYSASIGTPPFSWESRQCYDCAGIGNYIDYAVSGGNCKIRLGMTNGSATLVKILISLNGTDFVDYKTVNLKHAQAGMVGKIDVDVAIGAAGEYYVRIENAAVAAASCYVVGLNVGMLPESGLVDIDSAMFVQKANVAGVPNQYLGGLGANEFAAKEKSTGKFFGTYHGGHSDFLQRLRTDNASYNLDSPALPAIFITGGAQMHSYSKITAGSSVYQYTAETFFGDGAHVTTYSIKLLAGSPVLCERVYTHMCTTMRDFDWVHLPLTFNKTDDGDVNIGNCQFIQQFRAHDTAQINCYFSGVNVDDNTNGGAYVSFQPNYNKQYYGPALNSLGYSLGGGQFVTAKEYM